MTVVTGHYVPQGDDVIVTLEAIDVKNNRVVWQKTLPPAKKTDLIGLQSELQKAMQSGFLTALGYAGGVTDAVMMRIIDAIYRKAGMQPRQPLAPSP